MKILVTGAGGQLASELEKLSDGRGEDLFLFLTEKDLDISNEVAVRLLMITERPDYCINAAAYTAVDKAETEQELAFRVNADGAGYLAKACAENDAGFIHISTDYVFNGNSDRPYREEDATDPQSVYGASKLKGEALVMQHNPDAIIVRTAWVYSSFGHNFVKTMLRLMAERDSMGIVNDQQGCPTYAADLAAALLQIIDSNRWQAGIFHYTNAEPTTWFNFAKSIHDARGFTCTLNPITSDQYPTPAKRPAYSVLDTQKIRDTYGLTIRSWKEALTDCLQEIGQV